MKSPYPVEIGEFCGFKIEISFDSFSREFIVDLKSNLSHPTLLGESNSGNIIRIENLLNNLETKLEGKKTELENVMIQYENAKNEIKRPFPREEELQEKTKRLNELNVLLNLNEKTNEIIDDEKEEDRYSSKTKEDYER